MNSSFTHYVGITFIFHLCTDLQEVNPSRLVAMETSGPTSGILNAENKDGELDDIAEEDEEEEEEMSDEEGEEEEKDKEVSSMFCFVLFCFFRLQYFREVLGAFPI